MTPRQEAIRKALQAAGYLISFVEPDASGPVVIVREWDKGYLGTCSSLEKCAEVFQVPLPLTLAEKITGSKKPSKKGK